MVSIVRATVIALKLGEIRVYNEKQLVIKIPPRNKEMPDPVMGASPPPLAAPPPAPRATASVAAWCTDSLRAA